MTALRRHVAVLVLATVLGAAVAALVSWTRPDEYRATSRLFFVSSAVNVNDVYQATLAGVLRVETYKALASDQAVLNDAVREASVTMDPGTLQGKLHVDIPPGTLIMDISVDDPNPVTAAKLANGVYSQLIALVNTVERPLGGGPAPVGLSVIQQAVPGVTPQAILNPIFVAIGAGVGFVIGAGIALVLNALRRRRDNAEAMAPPSADRSSIPTE
jgi:capsular polysaccharide biosynthesis protein